MDGLPVFPLHLNVNQESSVGYIKFDLKNI